MSVQPFIESVKVVELLQRPFAQLPMSSDLPRLTNIRVVDEKGRSEYEQPPATAPTLAKLRYTFVALTALLLDDKAVEMTKNTFDQHFAEGLDVSKLSMEGFLQKIGGDQSPVVQVLKAVNQSAISPAIIHLKLKLGLVNMTKDVRDSWFYEVIVSASTGQVVVASHKRDQSIKNEFQYEWVMAVHFDKTANTDDISESLNSSKLAEDLSSSKTLDAQSTSNHSPSNVSSAPIAIPISKLPSSSPAASPRGSGSPRISPSPSASISLASKSPRNDKRRKHHHHAKEGSTSSIKSSDDLESSASLSLDDHVSISSEDDIEDRDTPTLESNATQPHKSKVIVSSPSAGQIASGNPTSSEQSAQKASGELTEEAESHQAKDSTVGVSDASDSVDSSIIPPNPSSSNGEDVSTPEAQHLSEEEQYFAKRSFEFSYKCTNASLTVSDLMFSLALHTTQQAKRAEILKILEPYSSADVIELSHSRNWEFFPASASSSASAGASLSIPSAVGSTGEGEGAAGGSGNTPRLNATSRPLNHSDSGIDTGMGVKSSAGSGSTGVVASGGVVNPVAMLQLQGISSGSGASLISPRSASSTSPAPVIQGIKEYDNGDRYEGGLCLGIREGKGKYSSSSSGVVYEGGYKDGKRHGQGHYVFATGAKVEGTFQRGVLVHGEYSFPNGDSYVGDFKDDKFDGQGEWTGSNGDRYKGAWKAGMRHGQGEAELKQGDSYVGEFLHDAIHGLGKYRFANGDLFNGQFSQGFIHGLGEYTFQASGKVLLGEFAQGKLIKSSAITNPISHSNPANNGSPTTTPSTGVVAPAANPTTTQSTPLDPASSSTLSSSNTPHSTTTSASTQTTTSSADSTTAHTLS
jgi:hypothetical protein